MSNDLYKILNTIPKEDLKIALTVYINDYIIRLYNITYSNKERIAKISKKYNKFEWIIYAISSLDILLDMKKYHSPEEMTKMILSIGNPTNIEYDDVCN